MVRNERVEKLIGISTLLLVALFLFNNCAKARFDRIARTCEGDSCNNSTFSKEWNFEPEWGACSKACDGGTQTRKVFCDDGAGGETDIGLCDPTSKPPETRQCNVQSCDSARYFWVPESWGACTNQKQTRTLLCYDSQTATYVDASNCTATPPETERDCTDTTFYTYVQDVGQGSRDVDILVVVDDSTSMEADQKKLGDRLGDFVTDLDNSLLDWQMCITTTDTDFYRGRAIQWVGLNNHILRPNSPNRAQVFKDTLNQIGTGYSNDEQGIKATYQAISDKNNSGCMRNSAALAVIVLSDEDERSVGGVRSRSSAQYKALEAENMPTNLVQHVQTSFPSTGSPKRFVFNSIIVKPGDTACEASQDGEGAPSFFGTKYDELSKLTGGYVASICDADYKKNLKFFQDSIITELAKVDLTCDPINVQVVTTPKVDNLTYQVSGNSISFTPPLPAGTRVVINYECAN